MSDSLFKASSFITAICFQSPAAPLTAGAGLPGCPLPWGAHPSRARSTHLSTEQKYQRGTTKTAQDWTLEDTTALENAPTNAFLRGHADASASGFANLCRAPELFPRQMPLSPQPAHSRTAPGGLEGANEFSSRQPFLWLGSSPGFPCVQCKRSARMPCRSVPRIHYRLRTDSSVVPCGVRLPPPPQLENVSAAGMTQCQVSPLRALELPPGRDWIVTGGPSRFRPADWPDRSQRSTAGSSWWPQFCQPRSPQRSEYTDPSSPCAGSGTSCLQ